MENQKTNESPSDEEIWDELLNSEEGAKVLEHFLSLADSELEEGKFIEE